MTSPGRGYLYRLDPSKLTELGGEGERKGTLSGTKSGQPLITHSDESPPGDGAVSDPEDLEDERKALTSDSWPGSLGIEYHVDPSPISFGLLALWGLILVGLLVGLGLGKLETLPGMKSID